MVGWFKHTRPALNSLLLVRIAFSLIFADFCWTSRWITSKRCSKSYNKPLMKSGVRLPDFEIHRQIKQFSERKRGWCFAGIKKSCRHVHGNQKVLHFILSHSLVDIKKSKSTTTVKMLQYTLWSIFSSLQTCFCHLFSCLLNYGLRGLV